ncbi:MAG TPA: fumarylacetoacetate hydrolase family protein [Dehalococcoidales bacterium]|nr:fumarylacetoacetate hydrolase family protein [Dehalococcoidales bacterium]
MKIVRFAVEEDAPDYNPGYTSFNDFTDRDLQAKDKQWTRSKGFDTFAPIGPCIDTELDPTNLTLETALMKKSGRRRIIPVNSSSLRSELYLRRNDTAPRRYRGGDHREYQRVEEPRGQTLTL